VAEGSDAAARRQAEGFYPRSRRAKLEISHDPFGFVFTFFENPRCPKPDVYDTRRRCPVFRRKCPVFWRLFHLKIPTGFARLHLKIRKKSLRGCLVRETLSRTILWSLEGQKVGCTSSTRTPKSHIPQIMGEKGEIRIVSMVRKWSNSAVTRVPWKGSTIPESWESVLFW